jgi:hypothetical protein
MTSDEWPCHELPRDQWCDHSGAGGFMGHTCVKAPTDARKTLIGVAAQLVAEMEADNGCAFFVSETQARPLNQLCSRDPMASMIVSHLSTLASGEHSEQQDLIAAYRHYGSDVDEVSALLNDIFDGTDAP